MVFFDYEALKDGKERVRGRLDAISDKEAREILRKQDLVPLRLSEVGSVQTIDKIRADAKKKKPKKTSVKSLSLRETIDFTNMLYTLSKAGIPLVESLYFLETTSESKKIQTLAIEVRRNVLAGYSLSDALSKFPSVFDDLYIGLVKAGEESGELEETLRRISYLLDKRDKLNSKIISTLAYPVFVMLLAFVVALLLLTFVFPAFKGMYDSMNTELPLITQILMAIGVYLKGNMFMIPVIIFAVVGSVYYLCTWRVTRRFFDGLSLRTPVLEKFVKYTTIANFIVVMKVAFEAGINMVDSLIFANLTVKNIYLRELLKKVVTEVQHGKSLSASLRATNAMPGIVMCMISTGEESGSLSEMLDQSSEYIDTQIDRIVDLMSKMVEPILFVIIGGIVLVLGLSLYLPLFQTYANIG